MEEETEETLDEETGRRGGRAKLALLKETEHVRYTCERDELMNPLD